jgi:hypothetical protein
MYFIEQKDNLKNISVFFVFFLYLALNFYGFWTTRMTHNKYGLDMRIFLKKPKKITFLTKKSLPSIQL